MITPTPEQSRWLEAEVAAGRLPSVEDAVRMAVADFKATNTGGLRWAKPTPSEHVHLWRGETSHPGKTS